MTDSLEQERETLLSKVEELTRIKFISRNEPPEIWPEYNDETKEAIEKMKKVFQKIKKRSDIRRLSKMMSELDKESEMSAETYLWWVNRY